MKLNTVALVISAVITLSACGGSDNNNAAAPAAAPVPNTSNACRRFKRCERNCDMMKVL